MEATDREHDRGRLGARVVVRVHRVVNERNLDLPVLRRSARRQSPAPQPARETIAGFDSAAPALVIPASATKPSCAARRMAVSARSAAVAVPVVFTKWRRTPGSGADARYWTQSAC